MTIKSLLSLAAEVFTQLTTDNNEVLPAKSLTEDNIPCDKSLI